MPPNLHKYLKNVPGQNNGFRKKRGFKKPEEIEQQEELPKKIQIFQKDRLRRSNALFYSQRKIRKEEKSLSIPSDIDLIRVHFFVVFNLSLQKIFLERYGLNVLEYSNFNKTVLFELTDEESFQTFISHIQLVFESEDDDSYEGKQYNLIALILNFEFITDKHRLGTITESGFLVCLITSSNLNMKEQADLLLKYLSERTEISYSVEFPEVIEAQNLSNEDLQLITKNFDVIKMITSSRPVKVRPGAYGEIRRDFGFDVEIPPNLPIVGIIDSGVSNIDPLRALLTTINYDHTNQGVNWDELGHGTMVAGLVAFGDDFHKIVAQKYLAKARISVIKTIHNENDDIDIPRLLTDIRDAKRKGVKLFNMSLNLPLAKGYNDSIGIFAYELDRISYEEDILIFMSVGNYNHDELKTLTTSSYHPAHDYARFFYELNSTSPSHSCWFTNIQEPSESMNNISIGALAGNLENNSSHDLTPASEYPAYYSRKFHYDYSQLINTTNFQKNQINKFLNKPDLVYEGGDLFEYLSGIEVLRSPLAAAEKYYGRSSGTSLATPLITSLAAELLYVYPNLNTQSIKALLVNNSFSTVGPNPPAFQNFEIDLYRKLTGFGKPKKKNLIVTDDNTAVFVIEDTIELEEVIVMPLKLPQFIAEGKNKLHVQSTLCYSFLPLKDNHLNYLPLHISFGVFKNLSPETIAQNVGKEYKIKSSITWSEDFHGVEKRLFSNTQKLVFNLQPYDLAHVGNEISIAVRCTCKKEIPESHMNHLKRAHPFSLVISLSEIPELEASGTLYSELTAINLVENITSLDGLADVELTV